MAAVTIHSDFGAPQNKVFDCVDHNKLWKSLKEMGIPDHQTCLLRNLYAGQEATVRTGHGPTHWFQIGKGVHQGCTSMAKCCIHVDIIEREFILIPFQIIIC